MSDHEGPSEGKVGDESGMMTLLRFCVKSPSVEGGKLEKSFG